MGHVRQTIKRWNAVLYVFICMDITVKKWCHWRREWAHSMYTCTINVPITTILDKLLKKFWLKECIWQPSLYLPTISRSWKNPIYLHFAYYQNIWLDHLKYKLFKNVPFKIPKDISCNWSEIQDGYHKGLIVHNLLLLMVNLK